VRHSRTLYVGDRLSLQYLAQRESVVAMFRAHWEDRQGTYKTFCLSPEALVNLDVIAAHLVRRRTDAEYAPVGMSWTYVQEPTVVNKMLNNNDISVEIELVPEPFDLTFPAESQALSIMVGGGLLLPD
jgi:hypothetical protein